MNKNNNKPFEKLFPHDGLVNFDPAFNRIREQRKESWEKENKRRMDIIKSRPPVKADG